MTGTGADAYLTPEARARITIDGMLEAAGWVVQDYKDINLYAGTGVAVREFILAQGHGRTDYLLFVNQQAVGAVEAKPEGTTLTGVEQQSKKYSEGLPAGLVAPVRPLPFLYESTGSETQFTNELEPVPRSRNLFAFYRPETFAGWLRRIRRGFDPDAPRPHLGHARPSPRWPLARSSPSHHQPRSVAA